MTPMQQILLGVGAKKKTYVDDVFSTYLWGGNNTDNRAINNEINLSGEGGMLWQKRRNDANDFVLVDTERGASNYLKTNSNAANTVDVGTQRRIKSFTSTGFTIGTDSDVNGVNSTAGDLQYSSWTFRKAKGFFDVVTYTGTGSTQNISHSLGCIPGMILTKCTSTTNDWGVYHRGVNGGVNPEQYGIFLNSNSAQHDDNGYWNDTAPTATQFTVKDNGDTNDNGETYVAYLFAGGESTAATARSVDFDGVNDALVSNTSTDYVIGTNDFTLEFWIKFKDNFNGNQVILDQNKSSNNATTPFQIYGAGQTIRFYVTGDHISKKVVSKHWHHVAFVRTSGTTTMYFDGTAAGTYSDSNNYDSNQITIGASGGNTATQNASCFVSNVRLVVGTAVYTSSFRPPTEPLTSITNTKLLCCNNSSVTGTTTGTVTSSGGPTASSDSPFDDPAAFKFGDSKEGIIKCGSYVGNGEDQTGPEINLGWEPQWIMIKSATSTRNWNLHDSMRGIVSGGNDPLSSPDQNNTDYSSHNLIDVTPTGFKIRADWGSHNESGETFIYIAIRRPDGYVGKQYGAGEGTSVFAMDTGNSSSTIPTFDSGFPVDLALYTNVTTTDNNFIASRLTGKDELRANATNTASTNNGALWDSNAGWCTNGFNSNSQSWMWKRHAGFDCITYQGLGVTGQQVPHGLNAVPEMMIVKRRNGSNRDWRVFHKGLNGGTNPEQYHILLHDSAAEASTTTSWSQTAPTSTHFTLGHNSDVNGVGANYLAILFASVTGISSVGFYDGSSSSQTITTGFQPRFLMIKGANVAGDWLILDTTRGWSSGNDTYLMLNANQAQASDTDFGAPTSTGFTLTSGTTWNSSGNKFLYYAHA